MESMSGSICGGRDALNKMGFQKDRNDPIETQTNRSGATQPRREVRMDTEKTVNGAGESSPATDGSVERDEWTDIMPLGRGLMVTAHLRWRDGKLYQWWDSQYFGVNGCWLLVGTQNARVEPVPTRQKGQP